MSEEAPAEDLLRVGIVGRGKVGRTLHRALAEHHVDATLLAGRVDTASADTPDLDVAILAVPDGAVKATAPRFMSTPVLLHCAGAMGVDAYGALSRPGLGAWHPLYSFGGHENVDLSSVGFAIDGDDAAQSVARRLTGLLGGIALEGVQGARYHAAAAMAANGTAALASGSVEILEGLGVSRSHAEKAIGTLLRSVAINVAEVGVPAALTGPIRRGDASTVRAHRKALQTNERKAYDAIAPAILSEAKRAGLSEAEAKAIVEALAERFE